jgi:hypothetical protein
MTHTTPAPRDRASDFSDAVVASYIHEISTRNAAPRRRRDDHSARRHASRSAESRARGAERLLQQ